MTDRNLAWSADLQMYSCITFCNAFFQIVRLDGSNLTPEIVFDLGFVAHPAHVSAEASKILFRCCMVKQKNFPGDSHHVHCNIIDFLHEQLFKTAMFNIYNLNIFSVNVLFEWSSEVLTSPSFLSNTNRDKFCPTCFPDCIAIHCSTLV